jgi:predicted kinase
MARQLAAIQGVPCIVLDFDADTAVLRQRLRQRTLQGTDASDASEAVLATQMRIAEPLQGDEVDRVVGCRAAALPGGDSQVDWSALLPRLQTGASGDQTDMCRRV